MKDLVDFAKRVEDQLRQANREPHWEPDAVQRHMAAVATRRQQFEQLAPQLIEAVIQPRLETLAGYFSNASVAKDQTIGHCACRFAYCDRFPANTKVAFQIEHDARLENVVVSYDVAMMPIFIKINGCDKLVLPLEECSQDAVAQWTEQCLLRFLDAYLRIDRGGEDFLDEVVTDPVCGMRISRSAAEGSATYRGHPYFFCSPECRQTFQQAPTTFVSVTVL